MTVEELLGRKTADFENLQEEYSHLLLLVHRIKEGEVDIDSVHLDLQTRSWKIDQGDVNHDDAC